jgi:hypothetical protein
MAAMMVASAMPALAAVTPFVNCQIENPPGEVTPGKVTGGITPSGNANSTCHVKPEKTNKGGSGGGGATVKKDFPVGLDNEVVGAHFVETPSGNEMFSAHFHPKQQ